MTGGQGQRRERCVLSVGVLLKGVLLEGVSRYLNRAASFSTPSWSNKNPPK